MPGKMSLSTLQEKVASLTPGTCGDQLWLLPSGPDQVHRTAMRGGPPYSVLPGDYTGWIGLSWHSTIRPRRRSAGTPIRSLRREHVPVHASFETGLPRARGACPAPDRRRPVGRLPEPPGEDLRA